MVPEEWTVDSEVYSYWLDHKESHIPKRMKIKKDGDDDQGVSLAKGPRAISLRLQQLWPMARWLRWEADPPVKLC